MTVCIVGAFDTMARLAHATVEATLQGMRRTLLTSLLWLTACGPEAPPALTVGAVAYDDAQLLGLTEARRRMLAHISAFGLAVADSAVEELGAPLVRRWQDDWLLETLAAELTLEAGGVGDDVLRAHYLTDPEYELTVRHVLFFSERWRTSQQRAAAKAKAERALDAIRAGADFAETAATLSEEPGAAGRQGLLTPGRKGAWVDEFWAAASALEPGEISPVTETQYGYHILRLEDRTVVPFEEARSRVAREVADRIQDPRPVLGDWVEQRTASIVLQEEALERLSQGTVEPSDTLAVLPGPEALTTADFEAWAATQPASWAGGAADGNVTVTGAAVLELARRRVALAEAARRELVVPGAERARLRRRWDDLAYRWSASLGFVTGMSVPAVSTAALQALGDPAQGATIVRDELAERAPLLEHRYDIALREPGA
jgi:hypothetical protein